MEGVTAQRSTLFTFNATNLAALQCTAWAVLGSLPSAESALHLWLHQLPQLCVGCWGEVVGSLASVGHSSLASMVCQEKAG